jgi:hypothetical protein
VGLSTGREPRVWAAVTVLEAVHVGSLTMVGAREVRRLVVRCSCGWESEPGVSASMLWDAHDLHRMRECI